MSRVDDISKKEKPFFYCNSKKSLTNTGNIRADDFKEYKNHENLLKENPVIFLQYKNQKHWPIEYVSPNIDQFGYFSEEWISKKVSYKNFIYTEDIDSVQKAILKNQAIGLDNFGKQYRIVCVDGKIKWIYHHIIINKDTHGNIISYGGYLIDVDVQRKQEENWRMAQIVFANTIEGIVITDLKGTIKWANSAFTKITGYTSKEIIGKNPRILKSDHHNASFYEKMWYDLIHKGKWQGEIWNRRKNGETYPEWMTITAVCDAKGNPVKYVSVFNDITDHMQKEEHIKYQAYHDALTGLPNRVLFKERLNLAVAHANKRSEMLAVIFLDLNRFKRINDILGYATGDILLRLVAERLKNCVDEGDTVARLSGDEFALIIEDIKFMQNAIKVANRVLRVFEKPFKIADHDELYVSASLGISIYPLDGKGAEDLVKKAAVPMNRAKEKGGNTYELYKPDMDEQVSDKLILENSMFQAINKNEFFLCYQPQVDVFSGKIIGAEALIRWNHPQLGFVSPKDFIPLAEENGFIVQIGEWVLREASEQLKVWHQKGFTGIKIAVNFSTLQFREKKLINKIIQILQETELNPEYLEMEITESSTMLEPNFTIGILKKLSKLGIQIAIDDFGTGYSSLAYLKRFPIHKLKIDRSFIKDVNKDEESRAIVSAIIAMSQNLGLEVLAEGVETEQQLKYLKERGCQQIQGYYFSPPVISDEFEKFLYAQNLFDC